MIGPTTPEGKARSSQNARRHGLSAAQLTLAPEEVLQFENLKRSLRAELQPQGDFEDACLDRAVNSYWRLKASQLAENGALSAFLRAPESEELQAAYERFFKYRRHHERNYVRALRDLRLAQENRFLHANLELAAEPALTPTLPLRQILRDFKKFQNELPKALCAFKVRDTECGPHAFNPTREAAREAARERRLVENRRLSRVSIAPTMLFAELQAARIPNPMSRSGFHTEFKLPQAAAAGA